MEGLFMAVELTRVEPLLEIVVGELYIARLDRDATSNRPINPELPTRAWMLNYIENLRYELKRKR
jgi:hypothetical protein